MVEHDPLRAALEIREQLASEKRKLALFFGAGTSMAVGVRVLYLRAHLEHGHVYGRSMGLSTGLW